MISGSSSWSSMPKFCLSIATIGRNGTDWPNEMQSPSIQVAAPPTRWRNSRSSLDLPMPASPTTKTAWPRPRRACAHARSSMASASSRPTNGERPRAARASSRETAALAPASSYAATGWLLPFTGIAPSARVAKYGAISRSVASATTIRPGSASCCMRAAVFVVSPTAV